VKLAVFQRDAWECFYCGCNLDGFGNPSPRRPGGTGRASVDHLTPPERGGTDEFTNLVASCKSCIIQKRTKTLEEYRLALQIRYVPVARAVEFLRQAAQTLDLADHSEEAEQIFDMASGLVSSLPPLRFHGEH
jgi:hypothetical protein